MNTSNRCDKCGGELKCKAGESLYTGKLRWYGSCSCKVCGPVVEADGVGFPSEDVRATIISESELWRVQLDRAEPKAVVAKVFRDALSVSPKDAISLASRDRKAIWEGTKVEVEWLVRLLKDAGISAHGIQEISKDAVTGV
jgi:hypothetical protein